MEDRETSRMCKYGESKTTRIMIATVSHVTSSSGLRKFQADGFLLDWVYITHSWIQKVYGSGKNWSVSTHINSGRKWRSEEDELELLWLLSDKGSGLRLTRSRLVLLVAAARTSWCNVYWIHAVGRPASYCVATPSLEKVDSRWKATGLPAAGQIFQQLHAWIT